MNRRTFIKEERKMGFRHKGRKMIGTIAFDKNVLLMVAESNWLVLLKLWYILKRQY